MTHKLRDIIIEFTVIYILKIHIAKQAVHIDVSTNYDLHNEHKKGIKLKSNFNMGLAVYSVDFDKANNLIAVTSTVHVQLSTALLICVGVQFTQCSLISRKCNGDV